MPAHKKKNPKIKIIGKLIKYFIFTICMSWSPMVVNHFVSFLFDLPFKTFSLYTPEICFMTIILASTNLKDLSESNISSESIIFICHIILNILNIVLSLLFIGISSYIELSSGITPGSSIIKQFYFVITMYFLAVILGSCVQIGGVIAWTK